MRNVRGGQRTASGAIGCPGVTVPVRAGCVIPHTRRPPGERPHVAANGCNSQSLRAIDAAVRAERAAGFTLAVSTREMATVIARDLARRATSSSSLGLSISLAHLRVIALAVVLGAAGLTRTAHLATYGFSEDEINKVQAVEEYRQGPFGGNAEHPMLMKLAMLGSVALSEPCDG